MVRWRLAVAGWVLPALVSVSGCGISPSPLNETQMQLRSDAHTARITENQESIHGPISLYEAIARAVKYNLDARVESYKSALRSAEARHASADMLPGLVAQAGYDQRSNDLITSNLDLPTGVVVPGSTTSHERGHGTGDVTFNWHVLDFALSYVRARQASNKHLIALELKRKITQRIVEDTRAAYWRALSYDRMIRKFHRLRNRAQAAVRRTRRAGDTGVESPMTSLTQERELVRILQALEKLQNELNLARAQLASLMNVRPGAKFRLVTAGARPEPALMELSAGEMTAEAVFNRPEIREVAYQARITEDEAVAAVLELLPGLKAHGAAALDDDSFLLANNWTSWGMAATGNLLNVVQLPARRAAITAQGDFLAVKALAVTMTVMTQVYVSRTRYRHFKEQVESAKEYLDVQTQLLGQMRADTGAELISEQMLVREEMNLLIAEIQYDIAVGNLQSASSNLMTTMGFDLQGEPANVELDVPSLARQIKQNWFDHASVSDRQKYLLELEAAREAERQRLAAIERARREEQERIAAAKRAAEAEAKRIADEAERRRKEEIRIARLEAKREREAEQRRRKAEAARLKREAQLAAAEAARERAEAERQRRADIAQRKREAKMAAAEAARERARAAKIRAREIAAERSRRRQAKRALQRERARAAKERAEEAKAVAAERKRERIRKRQAARRRAQEARKRRRAEAAERRRARQQRLRQRAKDARRRSRSSRKGRKSRHGARKVKPKVKWEWVWPTLEAQQRSKRRRSYK